MLCRPRRYVRLLMLVGLALLLGGCLQKTPATPNAVAVPGPTTQPTQPPISPEIYLEPVQLPKGYVAGGAIGDTLILRNTGQTDADSLVLFANGQLGHEIARQPWNTMADFASDERWFAWCEAKGEMEKKLTDLWKIWVWDSVSGEVRQIAQEAPKAEGSLGEIGPRLRLSNGRLIWPSVNPAPTSKVQLNLFDLRTGEHRVLATFEPTAPLRGYDIHGDTIAYGVGKQVVIVSGTKTETITSEEEVGEVLVTADGVAWQGRRLIFWRDARGTKELPCGAVNRWWYTSTDHYITWWEAPGDQLWLLHTPSGTAQTVIESGVNNGGFVFGKYVAWTQRGEGRGVVGMVAKLP
ncbi:MAG: hypothetical protein ACM3ZQ_08460 [Bacillota bacterium]